jgi:hypothetical protein
MESQFESRLPPAVKAAAPFLLPSTWGAVFYVWLGFPLGILYFVGLTVGLITGTALTIVWIGLALLLATLLAAWAAGGFERIAANLLLGAEVPPRRRGGAREETLWQRLRGVLGSSALWKSLVFLFLKFPLGLVGWVFSVVSLSVTLALTAAPALYLLGLGTVSLDSGVYEIESFWGTLPLGALGLAGFVVALHAHRALGWLWARLAEFLLAESAPAPAAPVATPGAAPILA